MSGDDDKMTDMTPKKPKRSLLERADQRFDFGGQQLRRIDPEEKIDGPMIDAGPVRARRSRPNAKAARVIDNPVPADVPVATATDQERTASAASPQTAAAPASAPAPAPAPAPSMTPAPATASNLPVVHRRLVPSAPMQVINRATLAANRLIEPEKMDGAVAEEFRLVKRQMLRNAFALPHGRRILVTSSQPDEGKSFSVINLALALASEQDVSVVLIDGDSVRCDVSRLLGLTPGKGLMDLLVDPSLDPATCIIPTDVPRLSVLPAGTAVSRDTELLASARMHDLLDKIEADAPERIILFDSMPLLAASSPGVIAQLCGQVLVVVRADVTRESSLRDAIGLIGQHDSISLLLNRVRFTPGGRRFGSYYGEGG